MKKKFAKKVALLLSLVMLLSSFAYAAEVDFEAKFDEALDIYRSRSLFGNSQTDYVKDALVEIFEEYPDFFYEFMNKIYMKNDRYSYYLAPEVYEEKFEMNSSIVGIGVVISFVEGEDYLTIDSVTDDGPADKAGLLSGDKILAVDGVSVKGFSPSEAALLVKGREGTTVKIKVLREGVEKVFDIKRATVAVSDVTSYKVDDKVGYIKLSYFNGLYAYADFIDAYQGFEEDGINTIILDLRDNPGGQLGCLVNIMDNVIPEKDVPYLMTFRANPMQLNVFESEGYGFEFNKFVILVNENTASASEIMAGAMQDLGYAVVVGKTTYGKGMGQEHIETSSGDEAVVTTFDLKLPVSGSYDGIGIKPDVNVDLKITPYKLPSLTRIEGKSFVSKIKTANVKALEERLSLLGYFFEEPDSVWDEKTVLGLNLFCRDNGLPKISSSCSYELLMKVDKATRELEEMYLVEDTQLERAIRIAKEYSESDKKAKCIDLSAVDFRQN